MTDSAMNHLDEAMQRTLEWERGGDASYGREAIRHLIAHLRSTSAPSEPTATFPALPIDAEDERIVDELFSKRAQAVRPMPNVQPPADGTGEVSDEELVAIDSRAFATRASHHDARKALYAAGLEAGRFSASAELARAHDRLLALSYEVADLRQAKDQFAESADAEHTMNEQLHAEIADLRRQLAESQARVVELEAKVKAWEPCVEAVGMMVSAGEEDTAAIAMDRFDKIPKELRPDQEGQGGNG